MKKNTLYLKNGVAKVASADFSSPLFICILFFTATLILFGCKDDDDDTSPDVAKLTGTYDVAETDMYNDVDNYTITISKSTDGGSAIEIGNFGDFMFKPVKGTIAGNTLTIPSQTFTANTTIKISGSGTLTGNNLHFDYTLESGGDTFEYSCEATKK